MEITDCPYAVGTPEHGHWVRSVFIPTVSWERSLIDRRRVGAESIGGKLVRGDEEIHDPGFPMLITNSPNPGVLLIPEELNRAASRDTMMDELISVMTQPIDQSASGVVPIVVHVPRGGIRYITPPTILAT